MKKSIIWAVLAMALAAGFSGCRQDFSYELHDTWAVTFFTNVPGDNQSITVRTGLDGRVRTLPPPPPWHGNVFRYWATPGGTRVTTNTVFFEDSIVIASWISAADLEMVGPVAARLNELGAAPANAVINVSTDEEFMLPQTLRFGGQPVTITLQGTATAGSPGRLTLSPHHTGALFTVGNGVTLLLQDNLHLSGSGRNTSALIVIEAGGRVEMEDGVVVRMNDNENTAHGGGFTVRMGGVLDMHGGSIEQNWSGDAGWLANWGGGAGVYVFGGRFYMRGGRITNNDGATSSAVWVNYGGRFEMFPGAEITSNISNRGIVRATGQWYDPQETYRWRVSTFVKHGGLISGNISGALATVAIEMPAVFTMYGGSIEYNTGPGLSNYGGRVTLRAGRIHGNAVAGGVGGGVRNLPMAWQDTGAILDMFAGFTISNNRAVMGGGVVNGPGSFFNMHGGVISGNTATAGETVHGVNIGGGGVFNQGGVFHMLDGSITNNRSASLGGIPSGLGGGVFNGLWTSLVGLPPGVSEGLDGSRFIMIGGTITNNTAAGGSGAFHNAWGGFIVRGRLGTYTFSAPGTQVPTNNPLRPVYFTPFVPVVSTTPLEITDHIVWGDPRWAFTVPLWCEKVPPSRPRPPAGLELVYYYDPDPDGDVFIWSNHRGFSQANGNPTRDDNLDAANPAHWPL